MRFHLLTALCCLAAVLSGAQSTTSKPASPRAESVAEKLVGTWQLVTIETVGPHGEVTHPYYGKRPEGLLIYDRSGWMSVQIVSDPKPDLPDIDSRSAALAATPEEKAKALDGYYAYFGTWIIDPSGLTVTHHLKQSLYPGERGENAVRQFSLDGDRLTLIAKVHEMGEDHQRRLVWERIRPAR